MGAPRPGRRNYHASIAILWVLLVVAGFAHLVRYSLTPGQQGLPPNQWPTASSVEFDRSRPTLVLALHPHCPCSRATVAELVKIASAVRGRCATRVLFVRPAGLTDPWASSPLSRSVRSIPGVVATIDRGGVEATRFGAHTSGQVALYDLDGSLVYHGGITGARGHVGENPGARAVISFVNQHSLSEPLAPVFGCPLEAPACDSTMEHPWKRI